MHMPLDKGLRKAHKGLCKMDPSLIDTNSIIAPRYVLKTYKQQHGQYKDFFVRIYYSADKLMDDVQTFWNEYNMII